ncbi:MAG: hypothetical protein CMF57_06365, partial [Leifsonia sp.]|nr:hypothetical protein [Leifsonia sp.]
MADTSYESWSAPRGESAAHPVVQAAHVKGLAPLLSDQQEDGVLVVDREGMIVATNDALLRRTLYSQPEVRGLSLVEIVDARHRRRLQALLGDAVSGRAARVEVVGLKRDGSTCELALSAIPLAGPDGDPVGALIITQNLADATAALELTARNEQLLRLAGRLAGLSGWSLDLSSGAITWSTAHDPSATPPPAILDEFIALAVPEDAARLERALARVTGQGRVLAATVRMAGADGATRVLRLMAEPVLDARGEVVGVQGASHDITQQVQRDESLQRADRMESLGSFASGIAHDLNNVLAPILMSAQLLATTSLDAVQQEMVASIQTAARRGSDMVSQVLAFPSGGVRRRDEIVVDALLSELEQIFSHTLPARIRLRIIPSGADLSVAGDATQLLQVLTNLCANARDAISGEGTISVTVRLAASEGGSSPDSAGRNVVIEVADTGHGMSSETIERLFEPFFTTKAPGSGTGLGLSMSASIVRNHGGILTAESDGRTGSRLLVRLPISDRSGSASAAPERDLTAPEPTRAIDGTVLLVDDESQFRSIARGILERDGLV